MPRLRFVQIHRGLGFKGWVTVALAVAVFFGIAIAVAVVAVGLLLVVVPAMVLAAVAVHLMRSFNFRSRPRNGPPIIEGEFRVVRADRRVRDDRRPPNY